MYNFWRDVAKSQLLVNTLILFQQNRSFIARWPFVVPAHHIVLKGGFSDKLVTFNSHC